jgi:thermostable 8-oxoguanine DNA glycosylase
LNSFENEMEMREWIVENIKGIGFKEVSHFFEEYWL